jgi:exonuclease III
VKIAFNFKGINGRLPVLLRWLAEAAPDVVCLRFERHSARAADILASGAPVVLAGDFNVMPTELDVYKLGQ